MVILKNFIKNLLPLFLYRILKKNFEKNKFTFVEKFSSYDAARSSIKITDYINEDLELSKSTKFHQLEDFEFDHKHNLLPIIFSILEKINSILEIGGGDNPALLYIKKANINKNIFSSVIEKKSFVKKFENKISNEYKDKIEYKDNLNDIRNKKYDVAYFGASIAYIQNHENLLMDIFKFNPTYIIISRTFFNNTDNEDFFVLQSNIANNIFPYKIICLKSLIKFLNLNSYSLIYEVELPTSHKHQYLGNIIYKDLIFKKE